MNGGVARALNKSLRLLVRPAPTRVLRLSYAVTYLCDSRCVMCDIWKRYRIDPSGIAQELTAEEVAASVTGSEALRGLDEIVLTGGEPFIKKDFVAVYAFFRQRYPRATVVVNTNGFNGPLIEKRTREMLAVGGLPPIFMFSVDGLAEVHEQIRGVRDGLGKIRRSVAAVRQLEPTIRLGLSFTIMPENLADLEGVYELSKELGASFTMRFASRSDTYYGNTSFDGSWTSEQLAAVEPAIGRVVADMLRRRTPIERALNPDTYFFSRLTDYQRAPRRIFECFSGTHSFFLDPWGNVFPCIVLPTSFGNLRERPFDELWFSAQAAAARTDIAAERCHCWTECEALPSLQRTLRRPHVPTPEASALGPCATTG
ncbi:MAG: radical SAM protein [Candidatus Binatia bacterium]